MDKRKSGKETDLEAVQSIFGSALADTYAKKVGPLTREQMPQVRVASIYDPHERGLGHGAD